METAPAKLTRREAADYIGVRYPTLCTWATTGGGPPFLKVGAKVLYLQRDLDDWLSSRRVRCTAELIPPDTVLAEAYARALVIAAVNTQIGGILGPAKQTYAGAVPPKSLRKQLSAAMTEAPLPWDKALYDLALTKVRRDGED